MTIPGKEMDPNDLIKDALPTIVRIFEADSTNFETLFLKIGGLNPETDFVRADLRGVDFSNVNLSRFDLTGADLRGANFSQAIGFYLAKLDGALLTDAKLPKFRQTRRLEFFIGLDSIVFDLHAETKRALLVELSVLAARQRGIPQRYIYEILLERERLGTTGVGNGIAITHGKISGLDDLYGAFVRLAKPIEFDSIDGQPIDIVAMILAPESEGRAHLKALVKVFRCLRDRSIVEELRNTQDLNRAFALLNNLDASGWELLA